MTNTKKLHAYCRQEILEKSMRHIIVDKDSLDRCVKQNCLKSKEMSNKKAKSCIFGIRKVYCVFSAVVPITVTQVSLMKTLHFAFAFFLIFWLWDQDELQIDDFFTPVFIQLHSGGCICKIIPSSIIGCAALSEKSVHLPSRSDQLNKVMSMVSLPSCSLVQLVVLEKAKVPKCVWGHCQVAEPWRQVEGGHSSQVHKYSSNVSGCSVILALGWAK